MSWPTSHVEGVRQAAFAIAASGNKRDQLRHGGLDQVDAGRFERLEKAARQADRDDVPRQVLRRARW
jgi:hypothetical protein